MQQTFAALKHPNYRLWFMGQLVSLVGTWMQTTAQGYLIYQLTNSPAFLGYVGFASGIPTWLFTLYGGVIADRIPRRTLMVITQTAMMGLAFILAGLVFAQLVQPWHIIVLAFLLGIANAFDAPARQAFVVELVERKDMTNAIALNAGMFNGGAVIGPAIAGVTYALVGPAWCFMINGLSFIAVIAALLMMKLNPMARVARGGSARKELAEGFNYLIANPVIMVIIGMVGMVSIFSMGLITLLPAWAVNVLHGDVTTNGLLLSARGLGAMIGALMVAALGHRNIRGMLSMSGTIILPVLFIIFALLQWLPLSLLLLVGMGWVSMMLVNSANALVQSHLPDQLRGRIMSIYTLVFIGGMPIGSLISGAMASYMSEPETFIIFSLILLIFGIFLWFWMPKIRELG